MTEVFDYWKLLAGLGIFLFGIFLMEDSIKELAGKTFKKLIRSYTETRLSAILSGTFSTAILQSSSAVNLMVLAFVGAGIMSLNNAVGVILGANIGTTLTAWIVAFFGFKVSIESFALPLIAVGGLGLILFTSYSRYLNMSKLLIGFGFLFHGLDYMKTSVEQITQFFDLTMLAGYGIWIFILAGLILTAVIQSSSATIAVVLTGIHSGIIDFESGAAMVVGANVGTTATIMLGSIGGVTNKKRVAIGHLTFNMITAVVALALFPVLSWLIQVGIGWGESSIMGIALFHTLFNLIGVMLFLPFIPQFTEKLNKLYEEPPRVLTEYIQNTSPDIADAALEAFRKEVLHQYVETRRYLIKLYDLRLQEILLSDVEKLTKQHRIKGSVSNIYWQLEELHGTIFEYYSMIDSKQLDAEESKKLDAYLRSSRSIMNATKNLKEVRGDLEEFEVADQPFLNAQYGQLQERLTALFEGLDPLLEEREEADDTLENVLEKVEESDMKCISESSTAIKKGELSDMEATSVVMVNRLFTQSCRMFVFSMENLLTDSNAAPRKAT